MSSVSFPPDFQNKPRVVLSTAKRSIDSTLEAWAVLFVIVDVACAPLCDVDSLVALQPGINNSSDKGSMLGIQVLRDTEQSLTGN